MSRDEYDELTGHLSARVMPMIEGALTMAGIKPDAVKFFEIVGGAGRIPSIQAVVKAAFPTSTMTKTLNPDECEAVGATWQGAVLSSRYVLPKTLNLTDIVTREVSLVEADGKSTTKMYQLGMSQPDKGRKTFYNNIEVRVNGDGLFELFSAKVSQKYTVEETIEEEVSQKYTVEETIEEEVPMTEEEIAAAVEAERVAAEAEAAKKAEEEAKKAEEAAAAAAEADAAGETPEEKPEEATPAAEEPKAEAEGDVEMEAKEE
ncbi:heat shock protein 70 family protein, partial [Kipferlia bialata]|eukprot:g10146.t1